MTPQEAAIRSHARTCNGKFHFHAGKDSIQRHIVTSTTSCTRQPSQLTTPTPAPPWKPNHYEYSLVPMSEAGVRIDQTKEAADGT